MTSSGRQMTGPDTPRGALLQRLEGIPEHEQHAILVDLVCATIATVLIGLSTYYTSLVLWRFCLAHPEVRDVSSSRASRNCGNNKLI